MTTLIQAFNNTAITENGCAAHHSSLDACLDLFYMAGASRGKDITHLFAKAYAEDKDVAIRILLWLRDARQGAGERQQFKNLLSVLVGFQDDVVEKIIPKVSEIGRWDDLLELFDTKYEKSALSAIASSLKEGNGLCAKWMPRQGKIANKIRKYMKIATPKEYRKLLVSLTSVVEQKMCAKEWDQINFESVPSIAASRYQKAFARNAPEYYEEYKQKLVAGEAKINASAVYPYDIVNAVRFGDPVVASEQWKALPDFMEGSDERILPVVDVSGSMTCRAGGSSSKSSISCLDVAISLGLYISERSSGGFKDVFMTFSERPELCKVSGSLQQKVLQMKQANWGMNTSVQAVFDTLLAVAKQYNVPEHEMPTKLLFISDMQFDSCILGGNNITCYQYAQKAYSASGYRLPQIVFWNVNSQSGTVPVTKGTCGTALVSGFSPSIMKSLLKGTLEPLQVMLDTVMVDRYKV